MVSTTLGEKSVAEISEHENSSESVGIWFGRDDPEDPQEGWSTNKRWRGQSNKVSLASVDGADVFARPQSPRLRFSSASLAPVRDTSGCLPIKTAHR